METKTHGDATVIKKQKGLKPPVYKNGNHNSITNIQHIFLSLFFFLVSYSTIP